MKGTSPEIGSFRDRNGRIYYDGDIVYRGISRQAHENWLALSSSQFFQDALAKGEIVHTEEVSPPNLPEEAVFKEWPAILKHQKIPFVSYPYEWPFSMLKDAALLQLDLLAAALEENMTLKDASSFNTQWIGAMPTFIDVPSFERYVDGTPWIGYRQFCEMFLYPLLLQAYKDVAFHPLLRGRIDGIPPEEFSNLLSTRDILRPGVFMHVYLQSKLQKQYGQSGRTVAKEIRSSGFGKELIRSNVKKLQRLIRHLEWGRAVSQWSHYVHSTSYSDKDSDRKTAFVDSVIRTRKWNLVWDIGCNTGKFSRIAASYAKHVVAMDSDHLAVEHLYRELKKEKNAIILPLVMNIADASPSQGWRGMERKAIAERGRPELIICLALIHHIVISANIPVKEFIAWLATFGSDLIIEFVSKQDPMVKVLLSNKDDQYTDYTVESFEAVMREHYHITHREELGSATRILYHAAFSKV